MPIRSRLTTRFARLSFRFLLARGGDERLEERDLFFERVRFAFHKVALQRKQVGQFFGTASLRLIEFDGSSQRQPPRFDLDAPRRGNFRQLALWRRYLQFSFRLDDALTRFVDLLGQLRAPLWTIP